MTPLISVCKEKQIEYELINVAVYQGEQKTPAFKQFHPFGQVPYINDDGFILYESRAICRYLAKKYAGQGTPGLIPADPQGEALFEQAASIEYCNFHPFAMILTMEKIIKKKQKLPADEKAVETGLEALNRKLDAYNDILGKQSYLVGESVTLADLFHLPYGSIVFEELDYSSLLENRPNVARWWKDISARPAWQAVKTSAT
ncbi:glutathione S-transferase [Chiua virens]|nr:glutathione S-transferase [Chiua virens]